MTESKSEHIAALAKELLDDIELSRIGAESLLLKASRLARLVGSEEIRAWLKLEMEGYNSSQELSLRYMSITGRWIDKAKQYGYWGPLAQQDAAIIAEKAKLASMRMPDLSTDYALAAINNINLAMSQCSQNITSLSGIKSRVLARLHSFVSGVYYEKEFDNLAESIFEKYKHDVDSLVADRCGEVLEKVPSVMGRLVEGDEESIRHALVTCRSVLDSFADSIYPPTDGTAEIGGNTLKLDASKHQNRINAYIHGKTSSHSRKQKLRQNLSNLYDRLSTGVHKEVTAEEARALFLNTYLIIGEILHLGRAEAQPSVATDPPAEAAKLPRQEGG